MAYRVDLTVKEMAGDALALSASRGTLIMPAPTIIEVAAKEVAEELERQGIGPDERVTLTIEPEANGRSPKKENVVPLVVPGAASPLYATTSNCGASGW